MNPSNSPNDSRENLRMSTDADIIGALLIAAKEANREGISLGLEHDEMEELESITGSDDRTADFKDWYAKWTEEREKRRKNKQDYLTAKRFALSLHSDDHETVDEKKKEEADDDHVKRDDEERSEFQKAKEVIKMRRDEISTTTSDGADDMEIDVVIQRKAPSLTDLSVRVLAQNSEAIKSLKLVPDHLRKKLSRHVSGFGKLDARFMHLLIGDSPCEIRASNCVGLTEDDLVKILCDSDRDTLKVLILDLCGRAITDYTITEFLKRSPEGFPSLTTLSLQGAFSLTDYALTFIASFSPLLLFINLSHCSLLTSRGLRTLADTFRTTLKGLSIEGCQGMKRCKEFTRSLYKFQKLNYLSVAGLDSVNDGVLRAFFMFSCSNLTDLSLANCHELTDDCIWHIGRYCKKLEALDISELRKLTDKSLEYLTEGCKSLNSVIFGNNRFSDEAVAAFLEVLGGSFNNLCLNKVVDIGPDTAFSLANVCKRLKYLDLSWCRKLTEEDLRRILSCCSSLKSLKLFGWTQVENAYLEELSRSQIHITGLKMTSLYAHLEDSHPNVGAKFF
ncbi:PREDICTED: F-box/LRR-repeat protein 2-like [Camelina sativa]|uniref:F-box/LRR-repeat protein 2-like n=1 Tax=Camelina sativa TaxID=90675 RepID=A0ABM0XZJ3_CAMSA|nr:PREDICTED: F-box/LRR-repeat protein 2-like [Camelina sativa]